MSLSLSLSHTHTHTHTGVSKLTILLGAKRPHNGAGPGHTMLSPKYERKKTNKKFKLAAETFQISCKCCLSSEMRAQKSGTEGRRHSRERVLWVWKGGRCGTWPGGKASEEGEGWCQPRGARGSMRLPQQVVRGPLRPWSCFLRKAFNQPRFESKVKHKSTKFSLHVNIFLWDMKAEAFL